MPYLLPSSVLTDIERFFAPADVAFVREKLAATELVWEAGLAGNDWRKVIISRGHTLDDPGWTMWE